MIIVILLCFLETVVSYEPRPVNQVVTLGSEAVFKCTTNSFGHGLVFYYQRFEGEDAEVLQEKQYLYSSFGKRLKIVVSRSKHYWLYVLTISNVRFYDFGIYICYNLHNKIKLSAILAVIGKPECVTEHTHKSIEYSCSIKCTDYLKVLKKWECNHKSFSIRQKPNQIFITIPGRIRAITINRYIGNATLEKSVAPNFKFKCNCTIVDLPQAVPIWIENADNTSLSYIIKLTPLSEIKFNVSASYNLAVEEPIMCYGKSNLSVTYLIIKSNNETTTNNILRYNHVNQSISLICYAQNGLTLEPLKTSITNLNTSKSYNFTSCDHYNISACFNEYFYNVEESGQFLRIQKNHYDYLCVDVKKNISECFQRLLPCRIPQKIACWIKSLYFLCDNKYLEFRKDFYKISLQFKCHTMYPQQLSFASYVGAANKFLYKLEYKQVDPPSIDMIYFKTCVNIENQIKLYCTTVAVRMHGSLNASYWHYKYFSMLKNYLVDMKEESEHYPVKFLESSDCRDMDLGRERNKACANGYKCYNFFDGLLSTYNLGIVYISDAYKTRNYMCNLTIREFKTCTKYILPRCSSYLQSILDPLTVFQKLLCLDYKLIYDEYHSCYGKLFIEAKQVIHCSRHIEAVVEDMYSSDYDMLSIEDQTRACVTGVEFLDCIQEYVTAKCKSIEAALLQRTFSRLMLAHGLRNTYCYHVFSHRSSHLIKTGRTSTAFCNIYLVVILIAFSRFIV